MIDIAFWEQVKQARCAVPEGRALAAMLAELEQMLAVSDAHVRDELAFDILGDWVVAGVCDQDLAGLGARMADALVRGLGESGTDTIFGRSFAALILGLAIERDNALRVLDAPVVRSWHDAAVAWFLAERDLRGVTDPERGVAHAVAHGADVIASLARHRHTGASQAEALLDAIVHRLVHTDGIALTLSEDERLAYATMALLHRGDISTDHLTKALTPVTALARLRHRTDLDPAAYSRMNALNWLRALHIQLALTVKPMPWYAVDDHFAQPISDRAEMQAALAQHLRQFSFWIP